MHNDRRGLDDNRLLHYDGLLHNRGSRSGGGGRYDAAEDRATDKPCSKCAAVAAVVVVIVVVGWRQNGRGHASINRAWAIAMRPCDKRRRSADCQH